jgi:2-alkyl-3-oxoalkanoate reductase
MRIFLTGATGALGRRMLPMLVAEGHDVVATTRSSARAAALETEGAQPVVLDGLDRAAVVAAVTAAKPDVVVHQMTALSGVNDAKHFDRSFAATNRLRTAGTDNLVAAAQSAGVRRLVAQSYAGWPNAGDDGRLTDEDTPLDASVAPQARESLAAIAHVERSVPAAPGIEGVVLRYGSFYGPGTSFASDGDLTALIRRRRLPVVGGGGGVWSFIHLDDAARATLLALDRGAPGVYNVVDDDPAPVSEWLPALASILGAGPPRRVPAWVVKPIIGTHGINMMTGPAAR